MHIICYSHHRRMPPNHLSFHTMDATSTNRCFTLPYHYLAMVRSICPDRCHQRAKKATVLNKQHTTAFPFKFLRTFASYSPHFSMLRIKSNISSLRSIFYCLKRPVHDCARWMPILLSISCCLSIYWIWSDWHTLVSGGGILSWTTTPFGIECICANFWLAQVGTSACCSGRWSKSKRR